MQEINTNQMLVALGQRVRQLRKRQGYSQEGFADATGLHRTWMGSVERGESNLSFHNLLLISQTLGMTLSQLLTGIEKSAEKLAGNGEGTAGTSGRSKQ